MAKPKKHRRHRPWSLNRCFCKFEKVVLGRRTMQERRFDQAMGE